MNARNGQQWGRPVLSGVRRIVCETRSRTMKNNIEWQWKGSGLIRETWSYPIKCQTNPCEHCLPKFANRIRYDHGVVVGIGVVIWAHPNPSYTKSSTIRPSTLTTTWAGKITPAGIVHVIRDRLVGLM